jgi:LysM repeat protein
MNIPACPYIGLQDDPETQVAFPSEINFCHHLKTPGPVSLEYQRTFCQSGRHILCEIFPEGHYTRLPARAQVVAGEGTLIRRPWLLTVVIMLFLFVAGGVALSQPSWRLLHFFLEAPPQIGKTLPAPPVTVPPSPTQPSATAASADFTSTAEITTTSVSLGTVALAPLGLETPIGTSPTLLIHRVLPGESLDLIAARFDTSVEAIQAINYFLPSPLLADLSIIIPLGQTQTAGLPQFEAYQVSVAGITIEQLAQSLGVNIVQLRKYNLLPEGAMLVAGQWLLLPRPPK